MIYDRSDGQRRLGRPYVLRDPYDQRFLLVAVETILAASHFIQGTLPLQTATTWRTPLFTIDKERTCTASHPCMSKVEPSYIWLGA